jgi:protease-4
MRNFLSAMLGSLVALFIFGFCSLLLLVGIAGAIISLTKKAAPREKIEQGSYLVFDLSANLTDAPIVFNFGDLSSNNPDTLQLRTVIRAINEAAQDGRIAGILLKGSLTPGGVGSGYGALQEVRGALAQFRRSGKPIKAYLDFATTRDYYLASIADEITLDPYGLIYMPGLSVEETFFAGSFEKYGVGIQVTRVGKYKSFVEPFVRKDMSPENREETQRLLDDLWTSILADVGRARNLTPAKIQATVDAEGLILADAAKTGAFGGPGRLSGSGNRRAEGGDRPQRAEGNFQAGIARHLRQAQPRPPGQILRPGHRHRLRRGRHRGRRGRTRRNRRRRLCPRAAQTAGRRQRQGHRAAGEQPGRQRDRGRGYSAGNPPGPLVKPVIVSMGAYAASGGYWISAYADRIFAEPTTITGSIGVFGIQFDVQKLANDFGVTFDG